MFVRAAEFWNAYLLSSFAIKKEERESERERKARVRVFFVDKALCVLCTTYFFPVTALWLCFLEEVVVVIKKKQFFPKLALVGTSTHKNTNTRGRRHETKRRTHARTHARAVESEREDSL